MEEGKGSEREDGRGERGGWKGECVEERGARRVGAREGEARGRGGEDREHGGRNGGRGMSYNRIHGRESGDKDSSL